jgi:hypothetical protein
MNIYSFLLRLKLQGREMNTHIYLGLTKRIVELYIHSPTCLNGVAFIKLSRWTDLPLFYCQCYFKYRLLNNLQVIHVKIYLSPYNYQNYLQEGCK